MTHPGPDDTHQPTAGENSLPKVVGGFVVNFLTVLVILAMIAQIAGTA